MQDAVTDTDSSATPAPFGSAAPWRRIALAVAVGAALVAAGHVLIVERSLGATVEVLRVRGDALEYIAAARDGIGAGRPPFRFRFVVPWLAGALPIAELAAFRLIAYVAMAATFAMTFDLARRAGSSRRSAGLGVALVFVSPWTLYVFHNPIMTDAAAHGVIAGQLVTLVAGATIPFVVLTLVGSGVRETTGVLAPALWSAGRRWPAAVATFVVIAIFVGMRMFDGSEPRLIGAARERFALTAIIRIGRDALMGWAGLWVLAPAGLLCIQGATGTRLRTATCWLLLGAALSSLVANDTGRMFAILLVPFGVGAAVAIERLRPAARRVLSVAFVSGALVVAVAWMPNRIIPLDSAVFQARALRALALAGSALPALVAAGLLYQDRHRRTT